MGAETRPCLDDDDDDGGGGGGGGGGEEEEEEDMAYIRTGVNFKKQMTSGACSTCRQNAIYICKSGRSIGECNFKTHGKPSGPGASREREHKLFLLVCVYFSLTSYSN